MEVRIKNVLLNETIDFLYEMPLRGRASRHRTRLNKKISEHIETVVEEEKEIVKNHCNLDENDEPKTIKNEDDQEVYDVKDMDGLANERNDLYNEEFIIDDSNSQEMLRTIRTALDEYDGELSGRKAIFYDTLCEIFQVDEDIEEDNKNSQED